MTRFHDQEWSCYPPQLFIKQANSSSHITLPDLHGNFFKLLNLLIVEGIILILENHYAELHRVIHLPIEQQSFEDIERCIAILQSDISFNPVRCLRLIGDECADRGINDFWTLCLIDQLYKNLPSMEILLSNHGVFFMEYMRDNRNAQNGSEFRLDHHFAQRVKMIERIRNVHPTPIWYDNIKMNDPHAIFYFLEIIRDFDPNTSLNKQLSIDKLLKDLLKGLGDGYTYDKMLTLVEQRRSLLNMHKLIHTYPSLSNNLNHFFKSYQQCLRLVSVSSFDDQDQFTIYSHAPIKVALIDEIYDELCYSYEYEQRKKVSLKEKIQVINHYFHYRLSTCHDYGLLDQYIYRITWEKDEDKIDTGNRDLPSSIMTVHGHTSKPSIRPKISLKPNASMVFSQFYGIDNSFGKSCYPLPLYLWEYFTDNKKIVIEKSHNYEIKRANTIYLVPLEASHTFRLLLHWHYYSDSDEVYLMDNVDILISINSYLLNWIGPDSGSFSRQLRRSNQEHCHILSLFLSFLGHITCDNLGAQNVCLVSHDEPMDFEYSTKLSHQGIFLPIPAEPLNPTEVPALAPMT
ncbi:MAG: hypothetical protein CL816_03560 [Coxiellaceae bacterium]|nr:hypothetical protein [Coxiellaceae bacterium]|tara:strand:+ start:612 stop:2330 length:1719 start_codon:yes stop_codon:yes gene_type:complete